MKKFRDHFNEIKWIVSLLLFIFSLVGIIYVTSRSQTVDFSGFVREIYRDEQNRVVYVVEGAFNDYYVTADDRTKYCQRKWKKRERVTADELQIGDGVTGDYRRSRTGENLAAWIAID